MAYQLEVIKFRDIIKVTGLPRFVPNQSAPTLEVLGEDFRSVEKVFVNDIEKTSYVVVNSTTLWVTLEPEEAQALRSVNVVSGNFTKTSLGSQVTFEIGRRTKKISGILKLLQLYVKWLLQSPGSDIFNPDRGGGLQDIVGRLTDLDKMDGILSAITRAITITNTQIKVAQAKAVGLPIDERLLDATLLGITKNANLLEAHARVHLVSVAGNEATSTIML